MKNIQAQYIDLLEGRMAQSTFMVNVRRDFPNYVSNVTSFKDAVTILKGKRILSEAAQGVYGHNPNAENPPNPGVDQLNYYQVYHGIQYELAKEPEITDEAYVRARKKVVDNIVKDPDAYKDLQIANVKAVKEMDKGLEMKEYTENSKVDKVNGMKVVQKNAKANTETTLSKKESKRSKNGKGVQHMTQKPKGKLQAFPTTGKEKVMALKEHILDEMTMPNPNRETFGVGDKVKKKDGSLTGVVVEWDGDTATVKTDDGKTVHLQGNVLTKKDLPVANQQTTNPWDRLPNLGAAGQKWASSQVKEETEHVNWDNISAKDAAALHDYHERTGRLPYGLTPEKYNQICTKYKLHSDRSDDVDPAGGHGLHSHLEEEKEAKIKKLKDRLLKTVKETLYSKGTGKGASTVVATQPSSQSQLASRGFRAVPGSEDIKPL